MAGIRKKGDAYYRTFRFQGRRYYFTVGNMSEAQALAKGTEVDETLALIERGRLTVHEGISPEEFVVAGGKVPMVSASQEWLAVRPESPFLFCQSRQVSRSKTKREGPTAVTLSPLRLFRLILPRQTRFGADARTSGAAIPGPFLPPPACAAAAGSTGRRYASMCGGQAVCGVRLAVRSASRAAVGLVSRRDVDEPKDD